MKISAFSNVGLLSNKDVFFVISNQLQQRVHFFIKNIKFFLVLPRHLQSQTLPKFIDITDDTSTRAGRCQRS